MQHHYAGPARASQAWSCRSGSSSNEREDAFMSPFACPSSQSRGRAVAKSPARCEPPFSVDRDRIVYCNAFRRLKHKTQVFLAPMVDDYRTRLTHTLEVAQMARDHRPGPAPQRGPDRGHRPGARSRPHALRPQRRDGSERDLLRGFLPLPSRASGWSRYWRTAAAGLNLTHEVLRRHPQALQGVRPGPARRIPRSSPAPTRAGWCASPISWRT
ncbi:MAG: hypothetical protein MZU95_01050 [Desulfomicrobium escambiense]|nr:hypothetical protein [Desulfomicrobium escambiense]